MGHPVLFGESIFASFSIFFPSLQYSMRNSNKYCTQVIPQRERMLQKLTPAFFASKHSPFKISPWRLCRIPQQKWRWGPFTFKKYASTKRGILISGGPLAFPAILSHICISAISVPSACAHLTLVLHLEEVMPNIMHLDCSTMQPSDISAPIFHFFPPTMHQPRHLSTDNSKLPQNSTNTCSTDCTNAH